MIQYAILSDSIAHVSSSFFKHRGDIIHYTVEGE